MNYNLHENAIMDWFEITRWKPVGTTVTEIVAGLASTRHLDTDWITEYLAYHDKPWDVSTTE